MLSGQPSATRDDGQNCVDAARFDEVHEVAREVDRAEERGQDMDVVCPAPSGDVQTWVAPLHELWPQLDCVGRVVQRAAASAGASCETYQATVTRQPARANVSTIRSAPMSAPPTCNVKSAEAVSGRAYILLASDEGLGRWRTRGVGS